MPVKNVRELKSQLRAKHKKIRKSCPPEKKQQLDLALQNAFLASEEYKSCDVLFAFVSSPIEVDTSLILETTLKAGIPPWIRQGLLRQIFTEFFWNKRWALLLQMYRAYSALGSVRPPR